jgi:hypothetical protein
MAEVLFISESYLRDMSMVGGNVQNNVLTSAIRKAQTIKIQSMLGKQLYDKLTDDIVAAGSITGLTGNYLILMESYIVPTLTSWALYESIMPLTLKITNKGISRAQDSYTEGIDLETMKYIRNDAKNEAEWNGERLINYLVNNTSLFPEYLDYSGTDLYPSLKAGGYNAGIYFKKRRARGIICNFFPDKDDYKRYEF